MSDTAQAHRPSGDQRPRNSDLIRLLEENLRLHKRIEAMAEEIAWLKRLHDKELEYRERELALREKSQPARPAVGRGNAHTPSVSQGMAPVNSHGEVDRREMSVADMQAVLEATLNGMAPEPDETPEAVASDQPTSAPAPEAVPVHLDAAPAVETTPSTNDDLPDIPAFLADPSGRRKVSLIPPSAKPGDKQPPRAQILAPKRRRLPGLAGLIG
jgi:hypothetical protein